MHRRGAAGAAPAEEAAWRPFFKGVIPAQRVVRVCRGAAALAGPAGAPLKAAVRALMARAFAGAAPAASAKLADAACALNSPHNEAETARLVKWLCERAKDAAENKAVAEAQIDFVAELVPSRSVSSRFTVATPVGSAWSPQTGYPASAAHEAEGGDRWGTAAHER
jgi:hypothetical protein